MSREIDSGYVARCYKKLEELKAPKENWFCDHVYDVRDDEENGTGRLATCDLCGCSKVRFVHVMKNPDYPKAMEVGCVCAGTMESDLLAAEERERILRNRAKRKQHFPHRKWKKVGLCDYELCYHGDTILIEGNRSVQYRGMSVDTYKGKPIDNFLSAAYAAFELVDERGRSSRCTRR